MEEYSRPATLEDLKVLVESLMEGLLRTKQTMRDKDVVDRIILERALATFRKRANDRKPGGGS
ncbi:hypothetical protein ACCAA_510056 [Candidatus Accumulibacter aalborgensis]|uniref:Uncharacterized protein n=1 Tax=Candidatus Accumulibacter aalborgensis TaxID=1860102 RepID=A0A1A8XTG2_9PROT|nr:hypothetical protein [Candidatus Accumulibacter aalborgensis]SBT08021.1 hypothetical protein ACCAA_510056 [Candidatus Accumulibacter aalborgensis]